MANLDTRPKRASSVQLLVPSTLAPVLPDGTVDAEDRMQGTHSYAGITAAAPAIVNPARRRYWAFWPNPVGPTHVQII